MEIHQTNKNVGDCHSAVIFYWPINRLLISLSVCKYVYSLIFNYGLPILFHPFSPFTRHSRIWNSIDSTKVYKSTQFFDFTFFAITHLDRCSTNDSNESSGGYALKMIFCWSHIFKNNFFSMDFFCITIRTHMAWIVHFIYRGHLKFFFFERASASK